MRRGEPLTPEQSILVGCIGAVIFATITGFGAYWTSKDLERSRFLQRDGRSQVGVITSWRKSKSTIYYKFQYTDAKTGQTYSSESKSKMLYAPGTSIPIVVSASRPEIFALTVEGEVTDARDGVIWTFVFFGLAIGFAVLGVHGAINRSKA